MAFRSKSMSPLDDCLYARQKTIPHLARSTLHNCFKRHGRNRLPQSESKPAWKRFKGYRIGCFQLEAFIEACNFAKGLKTLPGRSPYERIRDR